MVSAKEDSTQNIAGPWTSNQEALNHTFSEMKCISGLFNAPYAVFFQILPCAGLSARLQVSGS